ncbi:MAG: RNA chaperone Hfq [Bacillota bacterium]
MNKPVLNLQDGFLNQVRKENIPVTIYLTHGYQLKGMVKGFDNFTVILETITLENERKSELVYKHAISTIIPARPLTDFPYDVPRPQSTSKQEG